MNRSAFLLVALGGVAAGAAAQSSVTLYGLVDVNYQYIKSGALSGSSGQSINKLADGHDWGPGSRWGMRVSEDLGAGLRANVVLESGFNADIGSSAQGGRLFGRQAFVALSSTQAGEIRLGRQYILHDEVMTLNNPFGTTTMLTTGTGYATGGTLASPSARLPLFIDAFRLDNAVHYISPDFGGVRLQAMVAAGEGTADRYQGIKGSYVGGPLNIALSYEQSKAATGTQSDVNKITTLGANYDFGVIKVFGGYQRGSALTTGVGTGAGTLTVSGLGLGGTAAAADKSKAYTVGLTIPVGALTLATNYTRAQFKNSSTDADRTIGRTGVGAIYALSKLTSVYAALAYANGDLKDSVLEKRMLQVGLRKAF